MKSTEEITFVFTLSKSGEKIIKDTSLYSAQNILERSRTSGDLVESRAILVYTLVGRGGTELTGTYCSVNLSELQSEMKKAYKETIKDLQDNYLREASSCGRMKACIATTDDWYEWTISEYRIGI